MNVFDRILKRILKYQLTQKSSFERPKKLWNDGVLLYVWTGLSRPSTRKEEEEEEEGDIDNNNNDDLTAI